MTYFQLDTTVKLGGTWSCQSSEATAAQRNSRSSERLMWTEEEAAQSNEKLNQGKQTLLWVEMRKNEPLGFPNADCRRALFIQVHDVPHISVHSFNSQLVKNPVKV